MFPGRLRRCVLAPAGRRDGSGGGVMRAAAERPWRRRARGPPGCPSELPLHGVHGERAVEAIAVLSMDERKR